MPSFEKKFAEKQGRKYSVYVNNGSVANLLLIQSLLNMGSLKKVIEWVSLPYMVYKCKCLSYSFGLIPVAIDWVTLPY